MSSRKREGYVYVKCEYQCTLQKMEQYYKHQNDAN